MEHFPHINGVLTSCEGMIERYIINFMLASNVKQIEKRGKRVSIIKIVT